MKEFDTIAAISTGIGESGIAIIRISGERALEIVSSMFRGNNYLGLQEIKTFTLRHGFIIQREKNLDIDEVIVSYMKAPKSYTGEDVLEINCHGGIAASLAVLEEVLKNGARLAEPGEFTKRAFLYGRIELSQAEAVIDIIKAKTAIGLKSALFQAEGYLGKKINEIRESILNIIAHIEATVDYPEEDLEEITSKKVEEDVKTIIYTMEELLKTAEDGKIIREGINTVIVGKPNVGKSSLLNTLLRENRALVSSIPGTTRDIIEEYISIEGIPIKLVDTAGIRSTEDEIERMGVNLSNKKLIEADLVILVLDISDILSEEDINLIDKIKDKNYIILLNKSDLEEKADLILLEGLEKKNIISISNITGLGIDKLKQRIKELFLSGNIDTENIIISSSRHKEALRKAMESCNAALSASINTKAIDLASIDLKNAWSLLGEITGDTLEENIIDRIFSKFCIGK